MAIPELSDAERAQALEKAKAARIQRARLREEIKAGKVSAQDVLAQRHDPVIGRMKVFTLLETLPGHGKIKAERIMRELKIAPSRRLSGIGPRQLEALLKRLG